MNTYSLKTKRSVAAEVFCLYGQAIDLYNLSICITDGSNLFLMEI